MRKYSFQFLIVSVLSIVGALSACSPDNEKFVDTRVTDISKITRIELKSENTMLIADGRAIMNLTPILYAKYDTLEIRIPNDRVKDEWLEYSSESGQKIGRRFSTSDKSLIGKTIDVKVSLKGTSLVSNSAKFTVVEELPQEYRKEITFPVIFHIVRQDGEVDVTGLKLDKKIFYDILEKFNITFSGKGSSNPVGVDTYIRFKPALYTPRGQKLEEPGINRVTAPLINAGTNYTKLITDLNLLWNPQQYLNIWIVSNPADGSPVFGLQYLSKSKPKYKNSGAVNIPEGLSNLREYTPESTFSLFETGILYKMQDLSNPSRSYSLFNGAFQGVNELVYYAGIYFGLSENSKFRASTPANDYCDDTVGYYISSKFYKRNESVYKETPECFFFSENIMDDPTGMHISVSKDQAKRMRWVIENCPERASWKSSYALTGK